MMPAGGKDEKIVRTHSEGFLWPACGIFFTDFPCAVQHIEKVMFFQHTVRMRSGMDHGDMIGRDDLPVLQKMKIDTHG